MSFIDHADADASRYGSDPAGGETFQASLASPSPLSSQIRPGRRGGGGRALDSIFLDEGSPPPHPPHRHIERRDLEVVAPTLEPSPRGDRMVGVVTHVPELAERVPFRFRGTGTPGPRRHTARACQRRKRRKEYDCSSASAGWDPDTGQALSSKGKLEESTARIDARGAARRDRWRRFDTGTRRPMHEACCSRTACARRATQGLWIDGEDLAGTAARRHRARRGRPAGEPGASRRPRCERPTRRAWCAAATAGATWCVGAAPAACSHVAPHASDIDTRPADTRRTTCRIKRAGEPVMTSALQSRQAGSPRSRWKWPRRRATRRHVKRTTNC